MLSHDDRLARAYNNGSSVRSGTITYRHVQQWQSQRYVWVVTGPAGCGKTTVAKYLQDKLDIPYIEGDEYHSPANVEKMRSGIPLTDADRWDWLERLQKKATEKLEDSSAPGVILTCSALKNKYRDVIRVIGYHHSDVNIRFIYLRADEEVLLERVKGRTGHYMKEGMVHSQFSVLEEPKPSKEKDVLSIDVGAPETVVNQRVLAAVKTTLEMGPDNL